MEAHDEALPCLALTDTVRSPAAYLRLTEVWSHRPETPLVDNARERDAFHQAVSVHLILAGLWS